MTGIELRTFFTSSPANFSGAGEISGSSRRNFLIKKWRPVSNTAAPATMPPAIRRGGSRTLVFATTGGWEISGRYSW
ncbi:hypothetical protein M5K25_017200 [Dendrobium thyrsiflorum]|uniref:Uncharacterized protein n=1 Tax=Dendrobium thyrsiflorum TaxID=117978 RepID=A0ABD0UM42_DENTH